MEKVWAVRCDGVNSDVLAIVRVSCTNAYDKRRAIRASADCLSRKADIEIGVGGRWFPDVP